MKARKKIGTRWSDLFPKLTKQVYYSYHNPEYSLKCDFTSKIKGRIQDSVSQQVTFSDGDSSQYKVRILDATVQSNLDNLLINTLHTSNHSYCLHTSYNFWGLLGFLPCPFLPYLCYLLILPLATISTQKKPLSGKKKSFAEVFATPSVLCYQKTGSAEQAPFKEHRQGGCSLAFQ